MAPSIEQVVERVSLWHADEVSVAPLSGGLTNQNYVVTRGDERFVVRIPGASTELLAVDRANERHNAQAASTTGVSPEILEYVGDWSVMVLGFIEGKTMSGEQMRDPAMPDRIAASLHRLHAGPRFLSDFDMFRTTEFYLGIVDDRDVRIPRGFKGRMEAVADVERVLAVNAQPKVPCHNDLLAENYIDDGRQLWIVDFEYSGNGDPCFELGDTAQESGYDAELKAALCAAYFGRHDPVQLARMELYAMMADVGWTLWAAIQAQISAIDFDFWGWAVERWTRATAVMDGPAFTGALPCGDRVGAVRLTRPLSSGTLVSPMKVVATPEVVEFIRRNGGLIYVWTVTMAYGYGRDNIFVLEASVESPGVEREFLRFGGEGIEVLYDPGERGTPDSLHLALQGRVRKRVAAYWNGHNFGSD